MTMLDRLLRILLPGTCVLCDSAIVSSASGPDLCRYCLQALPWNGHACARCGEPSWRGAPVDAASGDTPPRDIAANPTDGPAVPSTGTRQCERCRRRPPPFTRTVAPLRYEGFPRAWVGRLKDRSGMVEGRLLGVLLAEAAQLCYTGPASRARPAWLIPVPLTAARLARRGHNQALTLALPVGRRLGIPVLRHALVRRGSSRRQRELGRHERLANPFGHFASRRIWQNEPCVAIVDDVMTTGATAAEAARVLLGAGAGEVHVLCATRTPRESLRSGAISA